jgi:hypothetical protein
MNKNTIFLIFGGSVLLIFMAIIFTNMIDKSKNSGQTDIRARASNVGYTMLTGTITSQLSFNQFKVTNLKFDNFEQKLNLDGEWTVTVANGSNNKVTAGNIRIFAHPDIKFKEKTLTAEKFERK